MRFCKCFQIAVLVVLATFTGVATTRAQKPVTIAIAGDSTVATYPDTQPQHGWGQYLGLYLDSRVTIINLAKGGRSTKTFLEEGLWKQTIDAHANYVLIQFGHNDSHTPDHPEHTDAAGDYTTNLERMVDEARAENAVPVLITPVMRRSKVDDLIPYAEAMIHVAAEKHVALIDLHDLSARYYKTLTPEQMELLQKPHDGTHFSATGATAIAGIVAHELPIAVPELAPYLKHQAAQ